MLVVSILVLFLKPILVFNTKMDAATLQDLMTPMADLGEGCGYQACPVPIEGMLNVHIVPHTHAELGGERHFQQYYDGRFSHDPTSATMNMKRILDAVITELWDHENRKFTLSDMPYLFHWWANRDDTVYRMVLQLFRQGRLQAAGGGWGMPDEATTSYHALIDHFTYSFRKLNRTFGPCSRPLVAWQADVMGHSREFAALAAQLGFDGLFLSPISFEDEVNRLQSKQLEMVWRGSDDLGSSSDIFTHKLFDGYWAPPGFCFATDCNDTLLLHSDSLFKNYHQRVSEFIQSTKYRQGGSYATQHVLVMMGKRLAYYDASLWFTNIDILIEKVNEKSGRDGDKVHAMYSSPACYLRAVHRAGVQFPSKQDDFMSMSYDRLTHFVGHYTSRPTLKYMAREAHVYLQMAKQLYVLANLDTKKLKLIEDLKWISGVFQDHGIITGAMTQEVTDYYVGKMHRAMQRATVLLNYAFNKLRGSDKKLHYYRCAFNISSCRNTNALRSFVVIYNPLAWAVTVPVRLPVVRHSRFLVYNHKLRPVKSVMMKLHPAVRELPRRRTRADHEIVFLAEQLPPLGFRSYYVESVTVLRRRGKRSIVKKLRKTPKKKYFARQTDQLKIDDKSLLNTFGNEEYDYDDEYSEEMYDDPDTTVTPSNISYTPSGSIVSQHDTTDIIGNPREKLRDTTDTYFSTTGVQHDTTESLIATAASLFSTTDIAMHRPTMKQSEARIEHPVDEFKKYDKINITDTETDVAEFLNMPARQPYAYNETVTASSYGSSEKLEDSDVDDNPLLRIHPTKVPYSHMTEPVPSDNEKEILRNWMSSASVPKGQKIATTPKSSASSAKPYYDGYNDPKLDFGKNYFYKYSKEKFIRNKYMTIHLDKNKLVHHITLSNGIEMALTINFYYYVSDDPMKLDRGLEKRPGPHIFRPMDPQPVKIQKYLKAVVLKTFLVEEAQYSVASWLAYTVRVYAERPLIEMDWVLGPVPIHDQLGKEIFVRYSTDLSNNGVFYTDSNGRQTVKRIRNKRASYEPIQTNIPSNIFPVTSKIFIEDLARNIRFSVFNDRSQGGTSLRDGQIDLMLHRRILTDENFASTCLNETEYGKGIAVRGKHYLYISKAAHKQNKIFEKKFAKEVELAPQIFASPYGVYGSKIKDVWFKQNNEFRGVTKKLPVGVHMLTLQEWDNNTVLLRLENYLEKSDVVRDGAKTVFVKDLFTNIVITGLRETTLGGNVWLEDRVPFRWNVKDRFVKNFNQFYGGNGRMEYDAGEPVDIENADIEKGIKLLPQQIRTFVVTYKMSRK